MIDATALSTFALSATADNLLRLRTLNELEKVDFSKPWLVCGGGSNIVLTKHFAGTLIKNELNVLTFGEKTQTHQLVTVGAGIQWHDFVLQMHQAGLYGLECLALIPGTVGAAPVQNIGAYGAEVKDYIYSVTVYDIVSNRLLELMQADCQFSYRDSIFKTAEAKQRYIITSVTFCLSTTFDVDLNYKDLREYFSERQEVLTSKALLDAVIHIRQAKLPDVKTLPNVGSFFKNPYVDTETLDKLYKIDANIPSFNDQNGMKKLSAAYLIDQLGLKGRRVGDAAVYDQHALILVNLGQAKAADLLALIAMIKEAVYKRYGLHLDVEPVII